LRFQLGPETQYLLTTVMEIDAIQYAMIEIGGLFVIFDTGRGNAPPLVDGDFEPRKGSRC